MDDRDSGLPDPRIGAVDFLFQVRLKPAAAAWTSHQRSWFDKRALGFETGGMTSRGESLRCVDRQRMSALPSSMLADRRKVDYPLRLGSGNLKTTRHMSLCERSTPSAPSSSCRSTLLSSNRATKVCGSCSSCV